MALTPRHRQPASPATKVTGRPPPAPATVDPPQASLRAGEPARPPLLGSPCQLGIDLPGEATIPVLEIGTRRPRLVTWPCQVARPVGGGAGFAQGALNLWAALPESPATQAWPRAGLGAQSQEETQGGRLLLSCIQGGHPWGRGTWRGQPCLRRRGASADTETLPFSIRKQREGAGG